MKPEDWPPELVRAAERMLDSALGLLGDLDPLEWPQSCEAAEQLLRTCAGLYADVKP